MSYIVQIRISSDERRAGPRGSSRRRPRTPGRRRPARLRAHRAGLGPERRRAAVPARPAAAFHLLRLAQAAREGQRCRATRWSACPTCWASTRACRSCCPTPPPPTPGCAQPNSAPPFGGRSALDRMLAGNVSDLNLVRRYLDGVRGGGLRRLSAAREPGGAARALAAGLPHRADALPGGDAVRPRGRRRRLRRAVCAGGDDQRACARRARPDRARAARRARVRPRQRAHHGRLHACQRARQPLLRRRLRRLLRGARTRHRDGRDAPPPRPLPGRHAAGPDAPADAPVPGGHRRPAARPAPRRQRGAAAVYDADDYGAAQALGARLHAAGSAGVAYRSVRHAARAVRRPVQAARRQPLPARRLSAVRLGRRSVSPTSTRRPHEGAALRPPRRAARRGHRLDGGASTSASTSTSTACSQPRQNFYHDPFWTGQRTAIVSLFLLCAGLGQARGAARRARAGRASGAAGRRWRAARCW